MILCPLHDFPRYATLHPGLEAVSLLLASGGHRELPEGRTDLDGGGLFVNADLRARTRPSEEAHLEAHRAYLDVQVVLEGREVMGWRSLATCTRERAPYDAERDVAFFDDAPSVLVEVPPDHLVVFFPEDAHAPLIGDGNAVRKLVFKAKV